MVLPMDDVQAVRQLLTRINDAWLKGAPDAIPAAMEGCFHERMVVQGPEFQTLAEGKPACIQSYVDFMRQAVVRECTLGEPTVHVIGETAIATYRWTMTYEMQGRESSESGWDVFAFTRAAGRWLAVWRTMLTG